MQTLPEFQYVNALRDTPVYSGPVVPGFEAASLTDWRDFSLFLLANGSTGVLTCTPTVGTLPNRLIVYVGQSVGTLTLTAEHEVTPGVWVVVATLVATAVGIKSVSFTLPAITSGQKMRVTMAATGADCTIRQLYLGGTLQSPIGQHVGLTPPGSSLFQGVVSDNVIAVNGSILARNYRREMRSANVMLEYLDPAWVRDHWTPFARHMARYACFYSWDNVDHPTDIVFAAASAIEAPENSSPTPKMKVSMPMRCLV